MRVLKNNKAFSLLEMMITVGIIGILAAIAVPNVLLYSARAKQKEGLSYMATLYGNMRVSKAQLDIYPTDFVAAGYRPEGEITYRIELGGVINPVNYPSNWYCDMNCISTAVACRLLRVDDGGLECNPAGHPNDMGAYNAWVENPNTVIANDGNCAPLVNNAVEQFTACAFADLGGATNSVISVDEQKNLTIVTDGTNL